MVEEAEEVFSGNGCEERERRGFLERVVEEEEHKEEGGGDSFSFLRWSFSERWKKKKNKKKKY